VEEWVYALAGSPWVFLVLYAMATIDGFFPPIPSESVVIGLAALAVSVGVQGPNLVVLGIVAALGAFSGDQIAYSIGKRIPVRTMRLMQGARQQAAINWAERALQRRGASFIIAARYVPIGRVAVNMTAGTVRFPRRRFSGLASIAAVTWSLYSMALGIGAGAWLGHYHPLLAVGAGIVGGVLLGFGIDFALTRFARSRRGRDPHAAAPETAAVPGGATRPTPNP
jgi:membrane-associated protein